MKTVGDFKKAGLVFVEGDVCQNILTGAVFNRKWVKATSIGIYDDCNLLEFAWRENIGAVPGFEGRIEVELTNSRHHTDYAWARGFPSSIKRWRPVLPASIPTETPEEKEAFEAMETAPEFKAGDVVEYPTGKGELMLLPDVNGVVIVRDESGEYKQVSQDVIKPINPQLTELVDIIGRHDDPTECAKAVLKAGYGK